MKEHKEIWDYFDDTIEYPREVAHDPIPYGTSWAYISSTFLDAMINYTRPISCFVIDRYTPDDESLDDSEIDVLSKGKTKFHKWKGTKRELINSTVSGEITIHHAMPISCFEDDIIILSKIETDSDDEIGRYMFFWFDCDVSDCCIGKFETEDSEEVVKQSVINWLEQCKKDNKGCVPAKNYDAGVSNYTELPLGFLNRYIRF